jgi:hypothetical protein
LSVEDADLVRMTSIARLRTELARRVERARILLAYREERWFFAVGQALGGIIRPCSSALTEPWPIVRWRRSTIACAGTHDHKNHILDLPRFGGEVRAWDQGIWSDSILSSCFTHSFVRPLGGAILPSRPARWVRSSGAAGGQGRPLWAPRGPVRGGGASLRAHEIGVGQADTFKDRCHSVTARAVSGSTSVSTLLR